MTNLTGMKQTEEEITWVWVGTELMLKSMGVLENVLLAVVVIIWYVSLQYWKHSK